MTRSRHKVWIVDDSALEARHAISSLGDDVECEIFSSGTATLERLSAGDVPAVLVLDWELPDISGIEVCRFIRASLDEVSLPILLVTSRSAGDDLVEGLDTGANDYLRKPYLPAELRARVRALTKLKRRSVEVEARLAATLRSIGDAVISTDASGLIHFMNPVAVALTGWSQDDALGRPIAEVFRIIHEVTRAVVESPVNQVLRDGNPASLANHTLLIRRDGSTVPIDDSAAPLRDDDRQLSGVVLVFRDVTARQRDEDTRRELLARAEHAQAKAQRSEERLRRAIEASGAGLWDLDVETGDIDADPRMVELMGLSEGSQFTLASGLDALSSDDRERVGLAVAAALAGDNGGRYHAEFQTGGSAGVPLRWVESRASVQLDADGKAASLRGSMVDVTQRKLAQAAQVSMIEALAAQPVLQVCVLRGPELVYEMVNPAYQLQTGRGRTLLGRPLFEAVPEVQGQPILARLYEVLATGVPYINPESRALIDRGDGVLEASFSNVVYQPLRGAGGEVDGILLIANDITGDVASRDALAASRAQLHAVFELAPAAVALLEGPEHRFALVNPRYSELIGARDVIGHTVVEALPEVVEQGFVAVLDEVRRSGRPYNGSETWMNLARGAHGDLEAVCLNFVYQPIASAQPDAGSIFVHAVDVTDLVRAREAARLLAMERQAAYDVLERAGTIYMVDARWILTFANLAFERFTGFQRAAVVGKSLWEVSIVAADPALSYRHNLERAMTERVAVDFVEYSPRLSAWTALQVFPTADGGLVVFVRDVTADKQAEAESRSRAEFERQLIGIVSHDLRTPLSTIALGTSLLMSREGVNDKTLKTLVRMQSAAERGARMVNDLLDFTQARVGGGITVTPVQGNLHTVVRQVVDDVGTTTPDRDVQVRASGDGHGHWDLDRMSQVLLNLISNAVKYSAPDSVVTVTSDTTTDGVTVAVHNFGVPIAHAALERIFQPMQRATSQLENKARSVGLGLFIVKHLVEAHGGRVSVISSEAGGTTFTFWVPKHAPSPR